jgi:hypothetical protein
MLSFDCGIGRIISKNGYETNLSFANPLPVAAGDNWRAVHARHHEEPWILSNGGDQEGK